jgi:bifunctional ADP-heptose synthase (sugar kinase/adenylyltransferase)
MDTRIKILTPEQAMVTARGRHVFVAYFDVLTAPLVRCLNGVGNPVTAIVLNPPRPLLPLQARAELVASLSCVGAVVPFEGEPEAFLQSLNPASIMHWEGDDSERTARLIEHVQTRYRSE